MDNVIPISRRRKKPEKELLELAQAKFYEAVECSGKKRQTLLKEALSISEDLAVAYLGLADFTKSQRKKAELYQKAIDASKRVLGEDWQKKYEGVAWGVLEARPPMHAMILLAICLKKLERLDEALDLYRALLLLNPNDNQGARYLLAAGLYESKRYDDEFEKLIASYPGDPCSEFLYTNALHVYRKEGASKLARNTLLKAFERNKFVPIFLSDIIEMPDDSPVRIGIGDETEAMAYAIDAGYLWYGTDGFCRWMAEVLADRLRKEIDDRELIEDCIEALKA